MMRGECSITMCWLSGCACGGDLPEKLVCGDDAIAAEW